MLTRTWRTKTRLLISIHSNSYYTKLLFDLGKNRYFNKFWLRQILIRSEGEEKIWGESFSLLHVDIKINWCDASPMPRISNDVTVCNSERRRLSFFSRGGKCFVDTFCLTWYNPHNTHKGPIDNWLTKNCTDSSRKKGIINV